MIVVRAGLFGRLLLLVPVEEIAEVLPRDERIVLRRSPRPTATERLRDLRRQVQPGGRRRVPSSEVGGAAAGSKRLDAQRKVKAVIKRLMHLIGRRSRRGGEREMTPDAEASAEPYAEEPPAEEQAEDEPAAEEASAEKVAEVAPAEEPQAEEPSVEESPAEEEPTT
jgi:hypothetical protein